MIAKQVQLSSSPVLELSKFVAYVLITMLCLKENASDIMGRSNGKQRYETPDRNGCPEE